MKTPNTNPVSGSSQVDEKNVCSACKEEIKPGAVRCPHCGVDHKWGKFSTIASVVGAVLAVLSLGALGWHAAVDIFSSKTANLTGSVAGTDNRNVFFTLSNKGQRPATIFDVVMKGPLTNETCKEKITFGVRMNTTSVLKVVDPGKTYAFFATIGHGFSSLPETFDPSALTDTKLQKGLEHYKQCKLAVSYIDFDNKIKAFTIPYYCVPQGPCPREESRSNKGMESTP